MTPPLLVDADLFAASVAVGVEAGVWTAVPLPLDEGCTCGGVGLCTRCVLDDERLWKRREDA